MNKIALYAIPSVLAVGSIFMVGKGLHITKDAALASSQIVIRQADSTKIEAAKAADIISAANAIEGFAAKCNLPLTVEIHRREITICSATKSADGKTPEQASDDKEGVLKNFNAVMSFFSSISTLPYKMSYKSLCVGMDCKAGIEAVISFGDPPKEVPAGEKQGQPQEGGQPQGQPGQQGAPQGPPPGAAPAGQETPAKPA
jgi:hypothetical protein